MWNAIAQDFASTFNAVPFGVAATRLVAAVALSAAVGIERELRRKAAGLRTNMLVALAACLFVLVGIELAALDFGDGKRTDPLRLIEAVTAGVAFLAAGLIFTSRGRVRNITTGATLWLSGAIGLACGAGHIPLAALAAAIVLFVLVLLRSIERRIGTYEYPEDRERSDG